MSEVNPISDLNYQNVTDVSESFGFSKDDFLELLVKELQYQDPLSPMSNQEFTSHLAQLSSLEKLGSIDSNLEQGVQLDMLLTQALSNTLASTLIGKKVKAAGNSFVLNSGKPETVYFSLDSAAKKIIVKIYDSSGKLVKEYTMENLSKGEHSVTWDGKDENGNSLPDGEYTFRVDAFDVDGNGVNVTTYLTGFVTGIKYEEGKAYLVVGDEKIAFSNVMEIMSVESVSNLKEEE
ncbi:MAG: hypothetical protein DRP91_07710 [Candidatus Neomarinimicrobiota bacterium]|nr:Ig-like domain repeat protein [Candidatus Neomarinimicrobiota bacterium]RKY47362.1 MAG: hypothetical protein DRP91_07710 [Candidatus Neomarinimicrobiota bacterium]